MAIQVKSVSISQQKYVTNTANAVPAYKAGIASPKTSQSAAAIAAIPTWQQAVSSPSAAAAMKSGLTTAGDSTWAANATNIGASRYPQGTAAGASKWSTNVQPYLQVIANTTLPPKGIKGAAQNYQRVQAVGTALHNAKLQKQGLPAGS